MAVHVLGIGVLLQRGDAHPLAAVFFANLLLMSSTLFMLLGFEHFVGDIKNQRYNYFAFICYAIMLFYYSVVNNEIIARTVCISIIIIFIDVQVCVLLFHRVPKSMRKIVRVPGLVMAGYVVVSAMRIVILTVFSQESELFRSGIADTLAITSFIALHICLIISLTFALTQRLLDEVKSQEERFSKAFHTTPYALIVSRKCDGRIMEVNKGFSDIFGYSHDEALNLTVTELKLWPTSTSNVLQEKELPPGGNVTRVEITVSRKTGEPIIAQIAADELLFDGNNCILSSINDVTEETLLRQKLSDLATKDGLTGLSNRNHFYEQYEYARHRAERQRSRMAVMSLDLDKFKAVNDAWGHSAGDAVLVEAAKRFVGCLRKVDIVSRFGGDEFVILLTEVKSRDEAALIANKVSACLQAPFYVQNTRLSLSTSIGIALYPDDGQEIEVLLKVSDEELYKAKRLRES